MLRFYRYRCIYAFGNNFKYIYNNSRLGLRYNIQTVKQFMLHSSDNEVFHQI